jgi:hypothetical protein
MADTSCTNVPCTGQSKGVPGALYLGGCTGYSITLCGDGGTLSGAGSIQVYGWPEFPKTGTSGLNLWARNKALDETVTVPSGTQCQRFAGHVADGTGWIYGAPTGVTVSAGVVSEEIDATCSN